MLITSLEITTKIGCTNNCSYCPQDLLVKEYRKRSDIILMTFDTFKECIDKLDDKVEIHFTGMCEPFLNSQCMDMIEYASSRHKMLISTTLAGLKLKDLPRLKRIKFIEFSIHLPAKTGDSIPVNINLLKAIEKIRNIKYHYHDDGPAIDFIKADKINTHSRAGNVKGKQTILKAGEICCERKQACPVLLPNGDLVLCCMDYGLKHIIGNLLTQGIDEIHSDIKTDMCKLCVYGYSDIGFVTYQNKFGGNAASTRIRVTWPAKHTDRFVITEDEELLAKCGAVVFQTRFSNDDLNLAVRLKDKGIKILGDFTDPDWSYEYGGLSDSLKSMIELSDCVMLSTSVLEKSFNDVFDKQTVVIPDRIDLSIYNKVRKHIKNDTHRIVWFGSFGNLESIELARADLEKLGKDFKITLVCIYDKKDGYKIKDFKNINLEYYEWTEQKVIDELLLCDVSINPRYDNWKSYKSNNKTVTAWALGIPCIERNFYTEIEKYLSNVNLRNTDGAKFRDIVVNRYDVKESAKELTEVVDNLIATGRVKPKKDITVYTSIAGGFDGLREDQIIGNADYVAFVDIPVTSYVWDIRKIYPKFIDPVLEAKIFKVLPWQFIDTEYSIWMDGCIAIKCDPKVLIDKFLKDADIAIYPHASRDDIYDEYIVDLDYRRAEPAQFRYAQREKYIREGIPKKTGLWECGIILRRHTEAVKRLCETWWAEITAFTSSDQCSFLYSTLKHGIKINPLSPGNMYVNPYFHRVGHNKMTYSIGPQEDSDTVKLKRVDCETFHNLFTGRMNYNDIKEVSGEVAKQLIADYPGAFVIIS